MLVSLQGCHAQRDSSPSLGAFLLTGFIVSADGTPAANSIVILTDPASIDEVAFTRTDGMGHFVVRSPIPVVGMTAATDREWGFRAKLAIDTTETRFQLSRDCTPLRGRIVLDDPPPWPRIDILRIGGFDSSVRGIFGMNVDSEARFSACLPASEYYITFPAMYVEQTILTRIPSPHPLVVHSATKQHAMSPPKMSIALAAQDRGAFAKELPSKVRLLGLGESNHGTREFTTERTQLVIELARQNHATLALLEAGYGEVLALDDYIKGASIPLEEVIEKVDYWMWTTREFKDSIEMLREYNRTVPLEQRVILRGVDIQSTRGALGDLMSEGSRLSEHNVALLTRLREHKGGEWKNFSEEDRASLQRALEQISSDRDALGLDSPRNRHALSARALLLALELLEQQGFWDQSRVRDAAMARMTRELLDLAPTVRATLWAHLIHLAREFVVGAPTLGRHLASAMGNSYRVYALLAHEGAARARDVKSNAVVSHVLPAAPVYALESVLAATASGASRDISYWTFDHVSASDRHWLQEFHFIDYFGAYYPHNKSPFDVLNLSSIDGAILFQHIHPSVSLEFGRAADSTANPIK